MKSIKIITSILLISLLSFSANALVEDFWSKGNNLGISTVYKLKKNKKIMASVRKGKKRVRPEKFKSESFREELLEERKRLLSMVGVKDFHIENQDWKEDKVFFKGNYKDNSGKSVNFIEVHHYHEKGVTQILIAGTEAKVSWKDKEILEMLKKFDLEKE